MSERFRKGFGSVESWFAAALGLAYLSPSLWSQRVVGSRLEKAVSYISRPDPISPLLFACLFDHGHFVNDLRLDHFANCFDVGFVMIGVYVLFQRSCILPGLIKNEH